MIWTTKSIVNKVRLVTEAVITAPAPIRGASKRKNDDLDLQQSITVQIRFLVINNKFVLLTNFNV